MPSPIGHMIAGVSAAWAVDLVPGRRDWRTAPRSASWYARAGNGLTLACALVAAAPDLDLVVRWHRAITHSLGAVLFVALFAAALAVNARRPVARVTAMCAGAYATHLLLDWLSVDTFPPYGIQALWPFDKGWYISGYDIFLQTQRYYITSTPSMRQNAVAVAQEIAILLPIAIVLWLVRVKTLTRLPTEMPGGDHAPQ